MRWTLIHRQVCKPVIQPGHRVRSKPLASKARAVVPLTALLFTAILIGCGGGGGGDNHQTANALSGVFLDDAVEGLYYETPTYAGTTDADGAFTYMAGEIIRFYMGDVMLGEGTAQAVMTPIDLVPGAVDETHPAVTNMSRLLQTADQDGNPDNGIHITDEVMAATSGLNMSFNMHPEDFDMQVDVLQFMSDLAMMGPGYAGRTMVSAEDAQAHLRGTMMAMEEMMDNNGQMMTGGGSAPGDSGMPGSGGMN